MCDQARAAPFDWDLHENLRFIRGPMFTGREVEYSTPEGQVLGAQAFEKTNFEEERGKRFREAMAILQGDNDATTIPSTAAAAALTTRTPASKIAGMAVASDYDSDGGDSDDKIRDDWVLEDSGPDTDFEALMIGEEGGVSSTREGRVGEGSGSEEDEEGDKDENEMGKNGKREVIDSAFAATTAA